MLIDRRRYWERVRARNVPHRDIFMGMMKEVAVTDVPRTPRQDVSGQHHGSSTVEVRKVLRSLTSGKRKIRKEIGTAKRCICVKFTQDLGNQ